MADREVITSRVRVLDIILNPPTLITAENTRPASGGRRTFTQSVPISDPHLFDRVRASVSKGDCIDVTVATTWYERDYSTELVDFAVPEPAQSKVAAHIA